MKNSVQIIGNVGNAPEVRELRGGKMVARFSVASHDDLKSGNGKVVEDIAWYQMVAWGGMAGYVARHVSKGKNVAIKGHLSSHSYFNGKGEKCYRTEIIVNDLVFPQARAL